jgi:hypothetical protein
MKALMATAAVLSVLFAASAGEAQLGPGRGRGAGWMADSSYARLYDAKTVETLKGEVVKIETFVPSRGMSTGTRLILKTEKETIPVHLGPSWYLDHQDASIAVKDRLAVTGSRIVFEGKPALVAREVRKGDQVLRLREEDGTPLWAGWRRR